MEDRNRMMEDRMDGEGWMVEDRKDGGGLDG